MNLDSKCPGIALVRTHTDFSRRSDCSAVTS
jgi:hypothetical protein